MGKLLFLPRYCSGIINWLMYLIGIYLISILLAFVLHGALPIFIPRKTPEENQILREILRQSKWPFLLYSISFKVGPPINYAKTYEEDVQRNKQESLARATADFGRCKLGEEEGAWAAYIYRYTWLGIPWTDLYFTCSGNGIQNSTFLKDLKILTSVLYTELILRN